MYLLCAILVGGYRNIYCNHLVAIGLTLLMKVSHLFLLAQVPIQNTGNYLKGDSNYNFFLPVSILATLNKNNFLLKQKKSQPKTLS